MRLDALCGIDHEQRTLTGSQRAGNLVGKVDVTWRIDEIQLVVLAVRSTVRQRHALRLDRDTSFPFQIHRIENLLRHFSRLQPTAQLDKAICQRRFAMVDMGND